MTHAIVNWLDHEQLPDLYRLLGKRLLDPDIDGLTANVKAAARELLPYQNHSDPLKAQRAMGLLTELGRVESLLADRQRLTETNQRLIAEVAAQCAEQFAAAGPYWKRHEVRAWLAGERQISPAALEEALVAACAALPQPPVTPKPVPIPLRVFGASGTARPADHHVPPLPPPAIDKVTLGDQRPLTVARPTSACPHCAAQVAAGTAICIGCGYDFMTGPRPTAKISQSVGNARPPAIRPPPPPGYRRSAPPARRSKKFEVPFPKAVVVACVVALPVLIAAGLGLLANRGRSAGDSARTMADAQPRPRHGARGSRGSRRGSATSRATQDGQSASRPAATKKPQATSGRKPSTNEAPEAAPAENTFDAAYRRAIASTSDDFVQLWDAALRLAPDAAARRRVHQTKIESLVECPPPLSADTLERLCAAYDLYGADAKNVGEQLTIADALVDVLRQKNALEAALSRYVSLRDEVGDSLWRETIVYRLTQECLSSLSALPAGERLAACERLVALAGDDATRRNAYRLLATDPAVVSQVPLEKLWEIFDTVLASTADEPLFGEYRQALESEVRRRGVSDEAIEHYQSMARQERNRALALRVLDVLAPREVAGPLPPEPTTPEPRPPDVPRRRAPAKSPLASALPSGEADGADLPAIRRSLDLLQSAADRRRASEADLEELYDSVVEQIGRTTDVSDLVKILIEEFKRRRRISHVEAHYEKQLKKDPNSLPALYFLVGAYRWRSDKGVDANRYSKKSRALYEHLQTLAPATRQVGDSRRRSSTRTEKSSGEGRRQKR